MSDVLPPADPSRDPENLKRLREEARRRLEQEPQQPPYPAPVYGSPPIPAPAYGGPPVPKRLLTVKGFLLAMAGAVLALAAWFIWGGVKPPMPAYGGPPAPVYGGPPTPPPKPPPKEPAPKTPKPKDSAGQPPAFILSLIDKLNSLR
jgi:hypothetical protein